MRNFAIGLLLGLALSFSIATAAGDGDPKIVGGTGKLSRVEVVGRDGKSECYEPEYLEAQAVISCE